ncbi:MAG: hypothetical protein ABIY48_10785, partial [Acidimicrobiales bacterium]
SHPTAHPAIARVSPALPHPATVQAAVLRLRTLTNELRDEDVREVLLRAAKVHAGDAPTSVDLDAAGQETAGPDLPSAGGHPTVP